MYLLHLQRHLIWNLYLELFVEMFRKIIKGLASDSKIGVNRTMLYQCNPVAFYQSKASRLQI